jgi:methylated-DNA-[protein]-cysteine S-methyltransferase
MHNTCSSLLPCGFNENALIAEVLGETTTDLSQQVHFHARGCQSCAALLERYRAVHSALHSLSLADSAAQGLQTARHALDAQLGHTARPRLRLKIWHSPVGDIRIGRTDKGVALVEFMQPGESDSLPVHLQQTFAVEGGGAEVTSLMGKLTEYFAGTRRDLEWIVDDALMRSDFQRAVLRATAAVPYGTVVTYQGIAETIGQPQAVRAVAQALRYNPVPIHIPCHRVIGSNGNLTGYAGNLVGIKKHILEVEGIPVVETAKGLAIHKERIYVGWRRDRWFCRPSCSTLKDQSAGDRAFISSRARAEEMGYQPCDVCRPDMPLLS